MIKAIRASYEILIIAFEVSAVGNCIVNVPFEAVKSPPNANTQTALVVPDPPAVVVLYINAPLAVKLADVNCASWKSTNAVDDPEELVTPFLVKVAPPAVYAVPDVFVISFDVL
jgi:hypothetical protein